MPDWKDKKYVKQKVDEAADRHGIPRDYLQRLIAQESSYRPDVTGPKTRHGRAYGLGQLMDYTARDLGVNRYDPEQNLEGTARLASKYNRKYKGDLRLMAAAHNAGEGAVDKYKGVPPYRETQQFADRVGSGKGLPSSYYKSSPRRSVSSPSSSYPTSSYSTQNPKDRLKSISDGLRKLQDSMANQPLDQEIDPGAYLEQLRSAYEGIVGPSRREQEESTYTATPSTPSSYPTSIDIEAPPQPRRLSTKEQIGRLEQEQKGIQDRRSYSAKTGGRDVKYLDTENRILDQALKRKREEFDLEERSAYSAQRGGQYVPELTRRLQVLRKPEELYQQRSEIDKAMAYSASQDARDVPYLASERKRIDSELAKAQSEEEFENLQRSIPGAEQLRAEEKFGSGDALKEHLVAMRLDPARYNASDKKLLQFLQGKYRVSGQEIDEGAKNIGSGFGVKPLVGEFGKSLASIPRGVGEYLSGVSQTVRGLGTAAIEHPGATLKTLGSSMLGGASPATNIGATAGALASNPQVVKSFVEGAEQQRKDERISPFLVKQGRKLEEGIGKRLPVYDPNDPRWFAGKIPRAIGGTLPLAAVGGGLGVGARLLGAGARAAAGAGRAGVSLAAGASSTAQTVDEIDQQANKVDPLTRSMSGLFSGTVAGGISSVLGYGKNVLPSLGLTPRKAAIAGTVEQLFAKAATPALQNSEKAAAVQFLGRMGRKVAESKVGTVARALRTPGEEAIEEGIEEVADAYNRAQISGIEKDALSAGKLLPRVGEAMLLGGIAGGFLQPGIVRSDLREAMQRKQEADAVKQYQVYKEAGLNEETFEGFLARTKGKVSEKYLSSTKAAMSQWQVGAQAVDGIRDEIEAVASGQTSPPRGIAREAYVTQLQEALIQAEANHGAVDSPHIEFGRKLNQRRVPITYAAPEGVEADQGVPVEAEAEGIPTDPFAPPEAEAKVDSPREEAAVGSSLADVFADLDRQTAILKAEEEAEIAASPEDVANIEEAPSGVKAEAIVEAKPQAAPPLKGMREALTSLKKQPGYEVGGKQVVQPLQEKKEAVAPPQKAVVSKAGELPPYRWLTQEHMTALSGSASKAKGQRKGIKEPAKTDSEIANDLNELQSVVTTLRQNNEALDTPYALAVRTRIEEIKAEQARRSGKKLEGDKGKRYWHDNESWAFRTNPYAIAKNIEFNLDKQQQYLFQLRSQGNQLEVTLPGVKEALRSQIKLVEEAKKSLADGTFAEKAAALQVSRQQAPAIAFEAQKPEPPKPTPQPTPTTPKPPERKPEPKAPRPEPKDAIPTGEVDEQGQLIVRRIATLEERQGDFRDLVRGGIGIPEAAEQARTYKLSPSEASAIITGLLENREIEVSVNQKTGESFYRPQRQEAKREAEASPKKAPKEAPAKEQKTPSGKPKANVQSAIRELLKDQKTGFSRLTITKKTNLQAKDIAEALNTMVQSGELTEKDGKYKIPGIDIAPPLQRKRTSSVDAYWGTPSVTPPKNRDDAERVWEDARATFRTRKSRQRGVVFTNEQGLMAVEYVISPGAKQIKTIDGIALPLEEAEEAITALRKYAPVWGEAASNRLDGIATEMEKAIADAKASGEKAIIVTNSSSVYEGLSRLETQKRLRRHEATHVWQFLLGESLFSDKELESDLDANVVRSAIEPFYPGSPLDELYHEALAFVASGDWGRAGFKNKTHAMDFLDRYFSKVVEKYGRDSLNELRYVHPSAKEVIRNVQQRERADTGRDSNQTSELNREAAGPKAISRPSTRARYAVKSGMASGGQGSPQQRVRQAQSNAGIITPTTPEAIYKSLGMTLPNTYDPKELQKFKKNTIEKLNEARSIRADVNKGLYNTLPGARAKHVLQELRKTVFARPVRDKIDAKIKRIEKEQVKVLSNTLSDLNRLTTAWSNAVKAQIAGRKDKQAEADYETYRKRIASNLSKIGEYTAFGEYVTKINRASIFSSPAIPIMNMIQQLFTIPLHIMQKGADFIVPDKLMAKYGLRYDKDIAHISDLGRAARIGLEAYKRGGKMFWGDTKDMWRYGTTRQLQSVEAARTQAGMKGAKAGAELYELQHMAKGGSRVGDKVLLGIGRIQGIADILARNVSSATALAYIADTVAKDIGQKKGWNESQIEALRNDLIENPSVEMTVAAGEEAARFVLDYPTFVYEKMMQMRGGGKTLPSKIWRALFDTLAPITKIPLAGVDQAFFRYSPVGAARFAARLYKSNKELKEKARLGKLGLPSPADTKSPIEKYVYGRDTAELLRQGAVGSAIWGATTALSLMGYIALTGGDDDRERVDNARELLEEGYDPELQIGGIGIPLKKMGAAGQLLAATGAVWQSLRNTVNPVTGEQEPLYKTIGRVVKKGSGTIAADNPFGNLIKGAYDLLGLERESGGAASRFTSFAANRAVSFWPGIFQDIAKTMAPNQVIAEESGPLGRASSILKKSIFGLRNTLPEKLSALGTPVKELPKYSVPLLVPKVWRTLKKDEQSQFIEKLQKSGIGLPKAKRQEGETAKEYNAKVKEQGKLLTKRLNQFTNPDRKEFYQRLTPAEERGVYGLSLEPQALKHYGKISARSQRIEDVIYARQGAAYDLLTSNLEYQKLPAEAKAKAKQAIGQQLAEFKASPKTDQHREKKARRPRFSAAKLARMAMREGRREAREIQKSIESAKQ